MTDWLQVVIAVATITFTLVQARGAKLAEEDAARKEKAVADDAVRHREAVEDQRRRERAADEERRERALAAQEQRDRLADQRTALIIQEELTTLEVQQAKELAATSEPHRLFLRALLERSAARYGLLKSYGELDPEFQRWLDAELASIARLDPHGTRAATALIERTRGDRSRYTWQGEGPYSKWQLLQRIAQKLAADTPPDEDVFAALTAELRTALPDLALEGRKALIPVTAAKADHQSFAETNGPVRVGGVDHVVHHSLGGPTADYGRRLQVPVIEHFRAKGYPIERAD